MTSHAVLRCPLPLPATGREQQGDKYDDGADDYERRRREKARLDLLGERGRLRGAPGDKGDGAGALAVDGHDDLAELRAALDRAHHLGGRVDLGRDLLVVAGGDPDAPVGDERERLVLVGELRRRELLAGADWRMARVLREAVVEELGGLGVASALARRPEHDRDQVHT